MKKLHLKTIAFTAFVSVSSIGLAQWDPNWYPVPGWNGTFGASSPAHPDATPWAVGGNQVPPAAFGVNGHSNYSCGTLDGTPFALKAGGVECIYMNETTQHVAIGPNHQPSVADCQLDIRGSGSNFRIFGNQNGDVESTTHMRLHYDNNNSSGTANFEVNQGPVGSASPRFTINGNGFAVVHQDLNVGGTLWNTLARLGVDARTKTGLMAVADNNKCGIAMANTAGARRFAVWINAGGGDDTKAHIAGSTQIGFNQFVCSTPGQNCLVDNTARLNVEAYGPTLSAIKMTTNYGGRILYIDNSNYATAPFAVYGDGKTHIGTGRPLSSGVAASAMLSVDGLILAKDIRVAISQATHWADYVFEKNYKLMPLAEVEKFVTQNKHLPGIPSEAEVKAEGVDVTEMNIQLLQKVEELYLYTIEMKKDVENLKRENTELKTIILTKK